MEAENAEQLFNEDCCSDDEHYYVWMKVAIVPIVDGESMIKSSQVLVQIVRDEMDMLNEVSEDYIYKIADENDVCYLHGSFCFVIPIRMIPNCFHRL